MRRVARGIAVRIEPWPGWLKGAALGSAVLLVAAAVAVPVTLHQRSRPVATARHLTATPSSGAAPSPEPSPTSLVASLSCRLPISSYAGGSGGFVSFPAGTFSSDPASIIAGPGANTYDRAAAKWLPVSRSAVTPDGTRYVEWDELNRSFRVVAVASGLQTEIGPAFSGPAWGAASIARTNGSPWTLLDAAPDGVYATPPFGRVAGSGLWFFAYSGGAEKQMATFGYWQAVGGSAAWGTRAPAAPQGATVTIVRLDLGTGGAVDWFSQDGMDARVAGFDAAGHPVVVTSSQTSVQVWLVDGQNRGSRVLALPRPQAQGYQQNTAGVQSVVGDANGVWLATFDALYLSRDAVTQRVSTVTGQIGGDCA
jgi:hypothetical protein